MKTRINQLTISFIAFSFLITVTQFSTAQDPYDYETFDLVDTLGDNCPNAIETLIRDINNRDHIVGEYKDTASILHGFYYDGYDCELIDYPYDAYETKARGLNNYNEIVGTYKLTSDGREFGFFYDGTDYYDVLAPDSSATNIDLAGINDSRKMIGRYYKESTGWRGFTYDWFEAEYEEIVPPGALSTCSFGINNAGKIVGDYKYEKSDPPEVEWDGFLYDGTTYTTFFYPDGPWTEEAMDINDADVIAGFGGGVGYGYLYDGTYFTTIAPPGARDYSTQVWGINNYGINVGVYKDASNKWRSFIATCINPFAMIESQSYQFLQDAYDAANNDAVVKSQAVVFDEDLYIDIGKSVYLRAGYDCDYSNSTGKTVLNGSMFISKGTLTIESGTFKLL